MTRRDRELGIELITKIDGLFWDSADRQRDDGKIRFAQNTKVNMIKRITKSATLGIDYLENCEFHTHRYENNRNVLLMRLFYTSYTKKYYQVCECVLIRLPPAFRQRS